MQHDNFVPTMTVGETLAFYGALALPPDMTPDARRRREAEVLEALGLHSATHLLARRHICMPLVTARAPSPALPAG